MSNHPKSYKDAKARQGANRVILLLVLAFICIGAFFALLSWYLQQG